MSPPMERRLAAILAADVVGYSRLVEADEAGTLSVLKDVRKTVLDPLLAEHRGRVVKLMGDGIIVAFGSVVGAVACAAILTCMGAVPRRFSIQSRAASRSGKVGC